MVARAAAISAWAAADGTPDPQLQADLAQAEAALKSVILPAGAVFDRAVMTASRQWVAAINPAATQAAVANIGAGLTYDLAVIPQLATLASTLADNALTATTNLIPLAATLEQTLTDNAAQWLTTITPAATQAANEIADHTAQAQLTTSNALLTLTHQVVDNAVVATARAAAAAVEFSVEFGGLVVALAGGAWSGGTVTDGVSDTQAASTGDEINAAEPVDGPAEGEVAASGAADDTGQATVDNEAARDEARAILAGAEPLPYELREFAGQATHHLNNGTLTLTDGAGNYIGTFHLDSGKVHRVASDADGVAQTYMVDVENLIDLLNGTFGHGPSYPRDRDGWDDYFRQNHDPDGRNDQLTADDLSGRMASAGPLVAAMLTETAVKLGIELGGGRVIGYAFAAGGRLALHLDNGVTQWVSGKAAKVLGKRIDDVAPRSGAGSFDNLVRSAQQQYPRLAGKIQQHHITPQYLGGASTGPTVPLDAAYHQLISNEFRRLHPYGLPKPTPERLQFIMRQVYEQFPLPGGG